MTNQTDNYGKLITLEGIEGVGKSSHVQFVSKLLRTKDIEVVITREPGGTEVAEAIREVLLKNYEEPVHLETEMLLLNAGRVQHVKNKIIPALEQGKWVVCDRFLDATLAYQGGGRNMSSEKILSLHQWLIGDFYPDLTLLLDAPVETAFSRIKKRNLDRIERESHSFFERTRNEYLKLAKRYKNRFEIIDASKSFDQVQQDIKEVMLDWI